MNRFQIARIVAKVKPIALLILATACGGEDGELFQDGSGGSAGSSQQLPGAGGEDDAKAGATATVGGSGGSSVGGPPVAQGGQPELVAGTGGVAVGGSPGGTGGQVSGAGQAAGGKAGSAMGGAAQGGGAQGGAGGKPTVDPLDPVPLEGCPGYVKVLVPKGSCVWFHGQHSVQLEDCSAVNPAEGKCRTVTAGTKDITSVVSDDAVFDRFDLEQGACPKSCP